MTEIKRIHELGNTRLIKIGESIRRAEIHRRRRSVFVVSEHNSDLDMLACFRTEPTYPSP